MTDGDVSNANWNRDDRQVNVDRNDATNENPNNDACSSVKVMCHCKDRSQPPSIRPISASLAWAWKILVSFAIRSSR